MALSPQQRRFPRCKVIHDSAENLARYRLKIPAGVLDSDMPYTQKIAYNKELAAIISQNPAAFSAPSGTIVNDVLRKTYSPLETYSFSQKAGDFLKEAGNQAVNLHDTFNPASVKNREATAKTIKNLLIFGTIAAAAVYFGPALFQGGQTLKRRTAPKVIHT